MKRLLRPILLLAAAMTPMLIKGDRPAFSQERQGCFMVDGIGQVRDLSEICPSADPFATTSQGPELGTGDIQVTLRWTTTDDLDLAVTDPFGQTVFYGNSLVSSGGQLDVDANAACGGTTNSPIENIFWPPSEAPEGDYQIEVNLFSRCEGAGPISFEVRLLVRGEIQTLLGTVDDANRTQVFPFSLP
ncbi:MAG: hypothetical protein VKL39_03330 [Leptolyngbyaceae bacterium]|nr:hypothetical protein [Leptolyngbyaceae bacterium]